MSVKALEKKKRKSETKG
jgi:hypothetical protein